MSHLSADGKRSLIDPTLARQKRPRRELLFGAPELPGCKHSHFKDEPRGYLGWHEWAEKKARTHDQLQCPNCGRWAIWKRKPRAGTQE